MASKTFKSAGFPAIVLNNGTRVVNYSSPHSYRFDTGEILPACDQTLVKIHSLIENHIEEENANGWIDVKIKDKLQDIQLESLRMIAKDPNVDVILVPLRVRSLLVNLRTDGRHQNEDGSPADYYELNRMVVEKTRVCRIEDRLNKLVSSTKFCK